MNKDDESPLFDEREIFTKSVGLKIAGVLLYLVIWGVFPVDGGIEESILLYMATIIIFSLLFGKVGWARWLLTLGLVGLCFLPIAKKRIHERTGLKMYHELCTTQAGIRIHKTGNGAEGLLIVKLDPKDRDGHWTGNQYGMENPYGYEWKHADWRGANYVNWFPFVELPYFLESGLPKTKFIHREFRPTGEMKIERDIVQNKASYDERLPEYRDPTPYPVWQLFDTPLEQPTARYELTWVDISTPEQRDYWIAGSRATIRDRQTGEVLAELTGFVNAGRIGYAMQKWMTGRVVLGAVCPFTGDNDQPYLPFVKKVFPEPSAPTRPNKYIYLEPPEPWTRTNNSDFIRGRIITERNEK